MNGTHALVSWEALDEADTGGDWVLSYSVLYVPAEGGGGAGGKTVVVPGNESSVLIGGLDPRRAYTVEVWATTAAGDGERSAPLLLVTPPASAGEWNA